MSLVPEQDAFLRGVVSLLTYLQDYCDNQEEECYVTGGELLRTEEQQAIYVENGASATYNSMHLKKCAIDLHMIKGGREVEIPEEIGAYWESLDPKNRWGGRWKRPYDPWHFERHV